MLLALIFQSGRRKVRATFLKALLKDGFLLAPCGGSKKNSPHGAIGPAAMNPVEIYKNYTKGISSTLCYNRINETAKL